MIILLKNKQTLKIGEHRLRCIIGENGLTSKKRRVIKKPQKEFFQLVIYTIEMIV